MIIRPLSSQRVNAGEYLRETQERGLPLVVLHVEDK